MLSNALVKLKERPPTRPRRAGEMEDEVSSTKPFVLVPRAVVSSSDSDGEEDSDGDPAGTGSYPHPTSNKPFELLTRKTISSGKF